MDFFAIEYDPGGELLGTEVLLPDPVQRFVGYDYVEAFCLFSSEDTARVFADSMQLELSYHDFGIDYVLDEIKTGKVRLLLVPYSTQQILKFLETTDQDYLAIDPDTPEQQVWDMEVFEEYLKRSL